MDGFKEFPCRTPLLKGEGRFSDEIRGVRPGNMDAESLPVPSSATILKSPESAPIACALPSSRNWNTAERTAIPCSRACSSVNPTSPISGEVKMAANNLALLIEEDYPEEAESLYMKAIEAGSNKLAPRNLALLIRMSDPSAP